MAHPIRFRVPRDPPMVSGHEERIREAGFVTRDWVMHILARQMDDGQSIPPVDPERVILADPPQVIQPPRC